MIENIIPNTPVVEGGDSAVPQEAVHIDVPVSRLDIPSHKKSPILLFIALALLSVVSVFAIYLFLQVRTLTLDATATPTPNPTPIASVDPTEDWQTYTNVKYKYQIKYPSDYVVGYTNFFTGTFDVSNGKEELVTILPKPEDVFRDFIEIQTINEKLGKKNFKEILEETYRLQKQNPLTTRISEIYPTSYNGIKVSEYVFSSQAIYTPSWGSESQGGEYKVVMFTQDDITYAIILTNKGQVFDQILSNFKFTTNADLESTLTSVIRESTYAANKSGVAKDQINVMVSKIDGEYAQGTVIISQAEGNPGSVWFASFHDGKWTQVWAGQEPPSCELMTEWNFPTSIFECAQ